MPSVHAHAVRFYEFGTYKRDDFASVQHGMSSTGEYIAFMTNEAGSERIPDDYLDDVRNEIINHNGGMLVGFQSITTGQTHRELLTVHADD